MSHEHVDDHFDETAVEGGVGSVPWKLIGFLVAVAILVVFFIQNRENTPVDVLFWEANWPLWAVIGVSVLLGMVIDRLGGWVLRRRGDR